MAMEAAMALTNRLLADAQALSAITAYLRAADESRHLDSALQAAVERVIDVLDARQALDALTPQERAVVIAFSRSYMHQALELIDEPHRPSTWSHSDPTILQAQGAASAVVARLIASSGVGKPSMRILDVGTGVGGLAVAFCQTFENSTVVGIDPWEPSLALARGNVQKAGLTDRISLLPVAVQEFADADGFDLVWLPSFFIPPTLMHEALRAIAGVLRPGAAVIMGVVEASDDPIADAVDAMITIRSGGSVLETADATRLLDQAGLENAAELPRNWQAPLRLVAAQKPVTPVRADVQAVAV